MKFRPGVSAKVRRYHWPCVLTAEKTFLSASSSASQ